MKTSAPVTYRPLGAMRYLLIVMFSVFAVAAVFLAASSAVNSGPPVAFVIFWFVALGWSGYWWLLRICVEISIDTRALRWSTTLRRGSVSLADLVRVRPSRLGRQVAIIETRDDGNLLVPVRYGFERLVHAISMNAPHVEVDDA